MEPIADKLTELSVLVGANQRYSQHEMTYWQDWTTTIAILVAVATLASLIFTVVSAGRGDGTIWKVFTFLSITASVASAIIAVVLNVAPTNGRAQFYADLFRRWSDLRIDVDNVMEQANAEKSTADSDQFLNRRYAELLAKKNAINALEPAPNDQLLERFLQDEEHFRGVKDDEQPVPDAEKQASTK